MPGEVGGGVLAQFYLPAAGPADTCNTWHNTLMDARRTAQEDTRSDSEPVSCSWSESSLSQTAVNPLRKRRSSYFRLETMESRRRRSSSECEVTVDEVSIKGEAHICFFQDGSCFHGHVVSGSDDQCYRLVGRLVERDPSSSETTATQAEETRVYDMDVIDLDDIDSTNSRSTIRNVQRTGTTDDELGLESKRKSPTSPTYFSFHTKQLYVGSGADMLIQRYFSSKFTDLSCFVCSGAVQMVYSRNQPQVTRIPETGVW